MKNNFKLSITLLLLSIAFISCSENGNKDNEPEIFGNIRGTVKDDKGNPIQNVNITLPTLEQTTLTDKDGQYEFKNLKPGQYIIEFTKANYITGSLEQKVTAGNTAIGDKILYPEDRNLETSDTNLFFLDNNNEQTFSITNNSKSSMQWKITYQADWIKSIQPSSGTLEVNASKSIEVIIDRAKLEVDKVYTHDLVISTGSGNKAITLIAKGAEETVYETDNDLCYVTTNEYGTKYAISSAYNVTMITDYYIKRLNAGNFYNIGYRWEASQAPNAEGIYTVTNAKPGTSGGNPLPGGNEFKETSSLPADYPFQDFASFPYLVDATPYFYSAYNTFNDKWIFRFSCVAYVEDVVYSSYDGGRIWRNNIKLNVVLQNNQQSDMKQDNHAMLNIYPERIDKNNHVDKTKDLVNFTGYAVVDMSYMRHYFQGKVEVADKETKPAYIQFQFYKYNTTTKKYSETVSSIGALPSTDEPIGGNTSAYSMIIRR